MKKVIVAILVLMIIILGFFMVNSRHSTAVPNNSKPMIKIGVSLPLSGDTADIGKTNMLSLDMALNKWKGKDTKYNYELVFEDDMLSPKQASLNANKLINVDKVRAIISMWAVAGYPIAEIADKNKVISFACAGGSGIAKLKYSLNNYTQVKETAERMAEKLRNEQVKTVAYFMNLAPHTDELADALVNALADRGISIVSENKFNAGTKDFRTAIVKTEEKHPDYYVVFLFNPDAAVFMKQFFELGGKKNITSVDSFHEMPSETWGLVEGLWFVKSTSGTDLFLNNFKETTGRNGQSCTGNLYDNLDLLIWAYEDAPLKEGEIIPNNESVLDKLKKVKDYNGAIGVFSIDDNGIVRSEASLGVIKDGEIITIKE